MGVLYQITLRDEPQGCCSLDATPTVRYTTHMIPKHLGTARVLIEMIESLGYVVDVAGGDGKVTMTATDRHGERFVVTAPWPTRTMRRASWRRWSGSISKGEVRQCRANGSRST